MQYVCNFNLFLSEPILDSFPIRWSHQVVMQPSFTITDGTLRLAVGPNRDISMAAGSVSLTLTGLVAQLASLTSSTATNAASVTTLAAGSVAQAFVAAAQVRMTRLAMHHTCFSSVALV